MRASAGLRQGLLALALAVALQAGPAAALEIDQIRVLSGAGQPLFAQIPLVVDNPGELQSLEVALASSATFARIGLPRPQGTVANLHFSVDRNPRQPMILVESSQPVTESFLTFLIQLQWNGGQMVREFSVSMGTPAASAPLAPALPEPASLPVPVAPPPVIPPSVAPEAAAPQITLPTDTTALPEQPQAVPLSPAPTQIPIPAADPAAVEPQTPPPAAAPVAVPVQAETPPIPVIDRRPAGAPPRPVPPSPSTQSAPVQAAAPIPLAGERSTPPAPAAMPATVTAAQSAGPRIGPVAAGDNLTRIAQGMVEPGQSLEQVMVALVRANPQAFANGNINQLQRGAQLRVPGKAEIAQMGQAQAEAAVREQTRLWLDGKAANTPALQPLATVTPPAPAVPPAVAPIPVVQTNPRLQILPPDAGAATTPGAASSAAQNEQVASALLQRQEDIAQLKERLANLEEVSRKQQQLIAMQDQQLRSRMIGGAGSSTGWIIALVGLLLGALIWWRTRPRALLAHPDRPTWHAGEQGSAKVRKDAA